MRWTEISPTASLPSTGERGRIPFVFASSMRFPLRESPLSVEPGCPVDLEGDDTMLTFEKPFSLALSRYSSGKWSMYFGEAKNIHKWLTDKISLQIMLMYCSLALKCMLSLPPCVLRLPCSKIFVAGITGCPVPECTSELCSTLRSQSFYHLEVHSRKVP